MSYGANCDTLELMGLLTEEEFEYDEVVGYLSAEEVFQRFKTHFEMNKEANMNKYVYIWGFEKGHDDTFVPYGVTNSLQSLDDEIQQWAKAEWKLKKDIKDNNGVNLRPKDVIVIQVPLNIHFSKTAYVFNHWFVYRWKENKMVTEEL